MHRLSLLASLPLPDDDGSPECKYKQVRSLIELKSAVFNSFKSAMIDNETSPKVQNIAGIVATSDLPHSTYVNDRLHTEFHVTEEKLVYQWMNEKLRSKHFGWTIPNTISPPFSGSYFYLKGLWEQQFDIEDTITSIFDLFDGSDCQINLMKRSGLYNYFENSEFQFIELRFYHAVFSLYIILPKEIDYDKFIELVNNLNSQTIENYISQLKMCNLTISLPRFTISGKTQLTSPVQLIQFVDLKVNETGIESGSLRTPAMEKRIVTDENDPVMLVNHPFLYFIRDNGTSTQFLIGSYLNPGIPQVP